MNLRALTGRENAKKIFHIDSNDLLERTLKGLVLLLLAYHVAIFLIFSYRLLAYPYEWAPSESDHIHYASRLLHGETIYKDNNTFPLLSMNYPPGYHILLAVALKFLGPTLFAGRIVSIVIAAALIFMIYTVVRRESDFKLLAAVMALSVLAYGPVSIWLAMVRMETLYVLLALAGIYLISKHERGHTYTILAAVCLACSFFTKQPGLFALGAALLFLFARKEYRRGFELLAVFLLLTIPLNMTINALTDGWYYKQLFGLNTHRAFAWWRKDFLLSFIRVMPVFLAATCYEILQEIRERKLSIWTCYLLGSLSVALLIFFGGTGENYFLPLFSAVLIMAGLGFSRGYQTLKEHRNWAAFLYVLIAFQLIGLASSRAYLDGPTKADRTELDIVAKMVRSSDRPVLIDRMNSLLLGTKYQDYFVEPVPLMMLYLENKWNPDVMVSPIRERKFSMILMFDKTQFVPPVIEAIERWYTPYATFPVRRNEPNIHYKLIVYRPKS